MRKKGPTMTHKPDISFPALDRPEVTRFLFHPRPDAGPGPADAADVMIPVEENVAVHARFHTADADAPHILFFHGNGEIVSDYDDLAPVYRQMGVGLLAVDYRGYGRSTGTPTVTAMMRDCRAVLDYVRSWRSDNHHTGPLILMGRSLGSAPAIELAAAHPNAFSGLIIESGFAYAAPLLRLLGIDVDRIGFSEEEGFRNIDKIRNATRPTLVIHAEGDHIIPFSDGEDLYNACGAADKTFLPIPGANHNDILFKGFKPYMKGVKTLIETAARRLP